MYLLNMYLCRLIIDTNILSLVLNAFIIQGFYSFSVLQYAPSLPSGSGHTETPTLVKPNCVTAPQPHSPWVGECDRVRQRERARNVTVTSVTSSICSRASPVIGELTH